MATRSKLAVILHADVVGSTTLVQKHERVAHDRMQDAFRRFSEVIAAYGGNTHELRGDALLAEFNRASDAVSAALTFQANNAEHNRTLGDELRPILRVGVSLGEVVIADDTLTGPDVVLAQRLEQLAKPGRVCVSQAVSQSTPRRLPFDYEDLGDQEMKGFSEPVHAYCVALRKGEKIPAPELQSPQVTAGGAVGRRMAHWLLAVVVVLLIAAGGGLVWWQQQELESQPPVVENVANPRTDNPSIAVLPFKNLSRNPEQEYFSDGLSEDLITDLSRISGLRVIARHSSFAYKGQEGDVQRIGRELGARYVLEGSVRKSGEWLRINAQLIDTRDGTSFGLIATIENLLTFSSYRMT